MSRQGLAFCGNKNEGNLEQLMKLSAKTDPKITLLMEKQRDKYFHKDVENEVIRLMAFRLLRDVVKDITNTDCSNHEQFVVCFRWVDKHYEAHEDFASISKIDTIKSDTLVSAITDILIRLNIPLSNACGPYYDGA